ncbi:tRNA isopentenyltransferase [Guyanagaster necrorhizus]|uniref:tRNA isopentenyltransferase n=1 Tax=Guyanagaster necrorhizus TaxID=856835 RepID=A0A9P7W587_9AGAR|nr:tRNA isopentenyltransferase [Guyanagaster necrorhizus MCA 3950]KAG7452908.1 tRNA isopentenyltransferase [Guyanagaster necrorhizus MCA 3950]
MALRPLIAICGTTGVGKSKLAIEIAQHIAKQEAWEGAEIINADAMQVYAGMDVITNKVTESEMQGIKHHLMGFRQPGEQYVVGQWVQDAIKIISDIHCANKIPIVVGGTSYWIQHLLFPNRLSNEKITDKKGPQAAVMSEELARSFRTLPPELQDLFNSFPKQPPLASVDPEQSLSLHRLLSTLDDRVGARWHWKDTRKVHRSLCIIRETGRKASEMISNQSENTVVARYRALCLWPYAKPAVLHPRLNSRVDTMITRGLLDEVRALQHIAISDRQTVTDESSADYTLGIYQSIGYREFHGCISSPVPSDDAFNVAVENMKISTRQYAKRQVSWIRNKLLPAIKAANAIEETVFPYLLDASDVENGWSSNVEDLAMQITDDFLRGKLHLDPLSLSDVAREMLTVEEKATDPLFVLTARRKMICEVCTANKNEPVMVEEGREWEVHTKTRSHKSCDRKAKATFHGYRYGKKIERIDTTESQAS